MIKDIFILVCLFLISTVNYSQGFNFLFKNWDGSSAVNLKYNGVDSLFDIKISQLPYPISQALTFTNRYGDAIGYFNGHQVRNIDGSLAINGDSLGWTPSLGRIFKSLENVQDINQGLGTSENAIILPITNDSLFLLFYQDFMEVNDVDNFLLPYMLEAGEYEFKWYSKGLLMSVIKVKNNGRLEVINGKKDVRIIEDFLIYRNMMPVRHANGKDWWIVTPCQHEDNAYSILVSDTTVTVAGKHKFSGSNTKYIYSGFGTSRYNVAGDKLVRLNYRYWEADEFPSGRFPQIMEVMDFDRCTGKIDGDIKIDSFQLVKPFGSRMSAEFSPSGRFLYLGDFFNLMRIDLNKPGPLFGALDTIYTIPDTIVGNGIVDTYDYFDHFDFMNRTPGNQILIQSAWATPFLHLIKYPDAEHISDIGYISRAVILPNDLNIDSTRIITNGMPRFTHTYMPVKACSTVVEDMPYVHNIRIYPNPTSDKIFLDTEVYKVIDGKYKLYNIVSGLMVKSGLMDHNSIDVSSLDSGFYSVKLDGNIIKFIKI